jgi:hypothetical protein
MKIAYRTVDEVNRYFAQRLAILHRAKLYALQAGRVPTQGEFDLVIYDLDFLPSDERASIVRQLLSLAEQPSCRIAVHGYHLDDQLKQDLQACGVTVLRILVPSMFKVAHRRESGQEAASY